jgi:hypothetical protein
VPLLEPLRVELQNGLYKAKGLYSKELQNMYQNEILRAMKGA